MLKKFVEVDADSCPSANPHEVRTFTGNGELGTEWNVQCVRATRPCLPQTSTLAQVLTVEDELRRLNEKAYAKQEELKERKRKKFCPLAEDFLACVEPQRTPAILKSHAITREKYLKAMADLGSRVHNAGPTIKGPTKSLVVLESPMNKNDEEEQEMDEEEEEDDKKDGEDKEEKSQVKLRYATPSCSLDVIFVPPQKVLQLKRPKSGIYLNSVDPPEVPDDGIPYVNYNPRNLQEKFDQQGLRRIDIIDGENSADMWTWNVGLQRRDSELARAIQGDPLPPLDCDKLELRTYTISRDISKHFTAQVVMGTKNVIPKIDTHKPDSPAYFNRPLEMAVLYAAYVHTFRFSPDFWTPATLDKLIKLGGKILKRSVNLNFKSYSGDFDIMKIIPECKCVIDLKPQFNGTLINEPNIYKALSIFFEKNPAAIVVAGNLYLLIWKRCVNCYYIFDPNGRDTGLQRNFEKGKCFFVCVKFIEGIVHLIVNLSGLDVDTKFTLYGISLVNFDKIIEEIPKEPYPKRYRKIWAVVNENYALIPSSNTGIHQPMSGKSKNASMIVSLFALLYGTIERATMWRPGVLDDIIRYGKKYHRGLIKRLGLVKRVKHKKRYQHLNITDVPELYLLGAYKTRHSKHAFLFASHVADCKNFMDSQLTTALKDFFEQGWTSALLQIDNSVLAIWRDERLYYVFDPFRRGKAGQVIDPDDYRTKGAACLQIHSDFDSFSRIMYMKAIKMRRGGKFFIHGIRIGCIRPMIKLINFKNQKYPNLKLEYPVVPMDEEEELSVYDGEGEGEDEGEGEFDEEVEVEQTLGKPKKAKIVRRELSIMTIPEADRIPAYEDYEIAEQVLAQILCDIIDKFPEPCAIPRPGYRQASSVLLRSDKKYLESLKYKLKHGEDYDNLCEAYKKEAEKEHQLSLQEELAIESNFQSLPDGSWVIFGEESLPVVEEDVGKLGGILSCLVAVVLSNKYCIATWGPEIVDFALASVNNFGEDFDNYEKVISALLMRTVPDIQIGENCYCIGVHKIIRSGVMQSMRSVLLDCIFEYSRFLVICQRFSCAIVRRNNFLYMFVGYACNSIGYRKFAAGPGCLLRFVELDALIRRIEYGCNPQGCEITNYVVIAVKVADITGGENDRFREWRDPEKEQIYANEYEKHKALQAQRKAKRDFLTSELAKEKQRIDKFQQAKMSAAERRKLTCCKKGHQGDDYTDYLIHGEDEEEYWEEEEEEIPIQHKPGKSLPREAKRKFKPKPIVHGYRRRLTDRLLKIQGTTALESRMEGAIDEVKACYFTSALAIIYAVLRPLNEWSPQRMDRVIEQGKQVTKRISNLKTANRRRLKNVTIDDYELNLCLRVYEVAGAWGLSAKTQIAKALQTRSYVMLQISNCTFAIYRDEVYHLFDPYASMEKAEEDEEEEVEEEQEINPATDLPEANTASWVLFADVKSMLKYINERALNSDWEQMFEFRFHVVEIVSHKKALAQTRILQLLTDTSIPIECKTSPDSEDETDVCTRPENICWIEMTNSVPIWSRVNRRNSAGKYRNLPTSKAKKFDIEIEGRLWSLWGNLHPKAPCFSAESRGKQYLACNVLACCAASMYRLADWSCHLMDNIIISGDKYHLDSLKRITRTDYEFSLEDLNLECELDTIKFEVHLEFVAYGRIYCTPSAYQMNLAEGLMYFFANFQFGILQVRSRSLAIGRILDHDGGYFMFDCQKYDWPVFHRGQGAAYILRTRQLQILLYCIVVALAIPVHNMQYTLHKVDILREGASIEQEEEEEEEDEQ